MKNPGKKTILAVIILILLTSFIIANKPPLIQEIPLEKQTPEMCVDCNLVIITIDTLRQDHVGVYGHKRKVTPNIDEFSKKSIIFQNAYSLMPCTLPSHASLFTGFYPRTLEMMQNWYDLKPDEVMLAQLLRKSGYQTHAFVNFLPLSQSGFEKGFQENTHYDESRIETKQAISWIRENKGGKFFTWIHFMDLHNPYTPEQEYVEKIMGDKPQLNATDENLMAKGETNPNLIEQAKILYDADLMKVDSHIGDIIATLENQNLLEKTIVIITSDHGEGFLDHTELFHGNELYDGQTRIPLILHSPKQKTGDSKQQISLMDLTPTLLYQLGLKSNIQFEGIDLSERIYSNTKNPQILESTNNYFRLEKRTAVLDYPLKYILTEDSSGQTQEVYNLAKDPREKNNLLEKHQPQAEKYKNIILDWKKQKKHRSIKEQKPKKQTEELLRSLGYLD